MPRYDWTDDGYFATERRDLGQIRYVLLVTMLLNFVATAIKITAGLATGASAWSLTAWTACLMGSPMLWAWQGCTPLENPLMLSTPMDTVNLKPSPR